MHLEEKFFTKTTRHTVLILLHDCVLQHVYLFSDVNIRLLGQD